MQKKFDIVCNLHELELYEDLLLFAELCFPGEPSKIFTNNSSAVSSELEDDMKGYLFWCIGTACSHLSQVQRAIRYYDMALSCLGNIRQKKLKNRYEDVLNVAEIRFQMHKLLLQNRQDEDALHCLECVPRADLTPKVMFAMGRLSYLLAKAPIINTRSLSNKRADPGLRMINYFKAILKEVPEAVYCRSFLLSIGAIKNGLQPPLSGCSRFSSLKEHQQQQDDFSAESSIASKSAEGQIWTEVKILEAKKCFLEAAQLLDTLPTPNLRFLLEQARFYRTAGNQQKALACFQQAHLLDSSNPEGMDAFAALLCMNSNSQQTQRDLDILAHKMLHSNPRRAESFVVYGWASRQSHRLADAKQFAQRAEQMAPKRGRQRCEALLLKAQLLFDTKRHFKEMETVLADALYNDGTNTSVYALYIQMFLAQKRYGEAQKMAKMAVRYVGENNQQIRFLYAQALADDSSSGLEAAISVLEKMAQERNVLLLEPLLLLSRLYDKQQKYEKAIALLNKFKESYGDPRIHRELGDLLSKTNRPNEALGEYGQAFSSVSETGAKEKIIDLMGGFTTPQAMAVNAAFENNNQQQQSTGGGGPHGPGGVRMPPPVTRITRRTAANQHEQLRRLRGMGTFSSVSSTGGNSRNNRSSITQARRSPNIFVPVEPLQFGDDEGQEEEGVEMDSSNNDSEHSSAESQLSLDDDEEERDEHSADGSGGQAPTRGDDSMEQPRNISGGFLSHFSPVAVRAAEPANIAREGEERQTAAEMPRSGGPFLDGTTAPGGGGTQNALGATGNLFVPLISDEVILEEDESHMSVGHGPELSDDEMN